MVAGARPVETLIGVPGVTALAVDLGLRTVRRAWWRAPSRRMDASTSL